MPYEPNPTKPAVLGAANEIKEPRYCLTLDN